MASFYEKTVTTERGDEKAFISKISMQTVFLFPHQHKNPKWIEHFYSIVQIELYI